MSISFPNHNASHARFAVLKHIGAPIVPQAGVAAPIAV